MLIAGGYPEAQRRTGRRRVRFFGSYVDTIIQRDLSSIARVHEEGNVRRLLQALASISSSLMNYDALSRELAVPASTLRPHTDLLETLFLIRRLPPGITIFSVARSRHRRSTSPTPACSRISSESMRPEPRATAA